MEICYSDNGKSQAMTLGNFDELTVYTDGEYSIGARFANHGKMNGSASDFWTINIWRMTDDYRYFDTGFEAEGAGDIMSWAQSIYESDDEIQNAGLEMREFALVYDAVDFYEGFLQKMARL